MNPVIIDILNELLAAEQRNVVTSLMESTMFVSGLTVRANEVLRDIARSSKEHSQRLVEAILDQGGVPGVRLVTMAPADLHFQEVSVALPRVLADRQALIQKYERAQQRVQEPTTNAILVQVLDGHRTEEAALRALNSASATAS